MTSAFPTSAPASPLPPRPLLQGRGPLPRHPPTPATLRLPPSPTTQLVQADIRDMRRRSAELSLAPDLVVGQCLGRGGYGAVYKGAQP